MYKYQSRIGLGDTDAAGIMFFANIFDKIHEAYESFLSEVDLSISKILGSQWALPIVRTESEYFQPLLLDEKIEIQISLEKMGETSFLLKYEVMNENGDLCCQAYTLHVAVKRSSGKKIDLPDVLVLELNKLDDEDAG
jgi:1,4-dihydroxy-2-naphthoyl-CoA hydrolase